MSRMSSVVKDLLDATIVASRSMGTFDHESEHDALVNLIAAAAAVIDIAIDSAFTEGRTL